MRSLLTRAALYGSGLTVIIGAIGAHLLATGPAATPEIDGATISAGLGLLAGGFLILRSRRRSK